MAEAIVSVLLSNLTTLVTEEFISSFGWKEEVQSLRDELQLMRFFLQDLDGIDTKNEYVNSLVRRMKELAYEADDVVACEFNKTATISRDVWKRIRDINLRAREINKYRGMFSIEKTQGLEVCGANKLSNRRAPKVDEAGVVGFTNDADTLIKLLSGEGSKCATISIVGMGGLGKTTLANKIYKNSKIRRNFELHAWIYVSLEYSLEGLMMGILQCITKVTQQMKKMDMKDLGSLLHSKLKGKRYLIVMDDVWDSQVWNDLEAFLPDDYNGSRILFTTRSTEVSYANSTEVTQHGNSEPKRHLHYLHFLNKEDSWKLFCSKAFPYENCSQKWEKLGRRIAEKCGGLPLAIVILGTILSEQRVGHNEWTTVAQDRGLYNEWSQIASNVSSYLYKSSTECEETLGLSYNQLPYHLRSCFLYFNAFPEEYQIPTRQLIQLWIAEGFIEANDGETLENSAEKYLKMLIDRGLIQVAQRRLDGGVKTCKIHCLLRDFCISKAQQVQFHQAHRCSPYITEAQRLAGNGNTLDHFLKNANNISRLSSLLCFTHMSGTSSEWSNLFRNTKLLKVFNVAYVSFLPHEVGTLVNLRYLGLDKNSLLKFPDSICELLNLQVLDARSKFIRYAPDIWKLKKLRHVYFNGPTYLPKPPTVSPSSADEHGPYLLKDLQTLSTVSSQSCTTEVFQLIPNLLKLGIIVKGHLTDLSENLVILKHLRTLKLAGAAGFPPLISLPVQFPPSITKLTIDDTQLEEDPMPLLGELQKLEILKLVNDAYTGRKMVCCACRFPQLRILKLVRLEFVFDLIVEEGALPNLQYLVIHDCYNLEFTGLEHLTSLQDVDLHKPNTLLREQMQQSQEKNKFQLHMYDDDSTLGIETWSEQLTEDSIKHLTRGKWTEPGESSKGTTT